MLHICFSRFNKVRDQFVSTFKLNFYLGKCILKTILQRHQGIKNTNYIEEDKDNLKKYLTEQFKKKGYNSNKIIEHLDSGLSLKEALEKDDIKSSGATSNTLTSSNKRTSNNR